MTELTDLSETDASNTTITSIDIDESCAPSGINNAIRNTLGLIRRAFKSSIFRLRDSTDQTKLLALDLSTIGTGTTLTVNPFNLIKSQRQFISGLTLSNNSTDATNDIDIATGLASSDDTTSPYLLIQGTNPLTKRLDAAWAVGSANGGLDTGSIANAIYHVWLIQRSDTSVVDALFSLSATAPTMPANYDRKRRIGAIIRASGAIIPFVQYGDKFLRSIPVQSVSTTNPGISAVTVANQNIPGPASNGEVSAIMSVQLTSATVATSYAGLVTAMEQADTTPTTTLNNLVLRTGPAAGTYQALTNLEIPVNTSSQFRYRLSVSDASVTISIITHGWIDRRGQGQ